MERTKEVFQFLKYRYGLDNLQLTWRPLFDQLKQFSTSYGYIMYQISPKVNEMKNMTKGARELKGVELH